MALPIVRVSVMRCEASQFLDFTHLMTESEQVLAEGVRAMRGCKFYFAGADEATLSLSNVSVWDTLADARQMESFQPMLDLGKRFNDLGARFERPIMNYATLWQIGDMPGDATG